MENKTQLLIQKYQFRFFEETFRTSNPKRVIYFGEQGIFIFSKWFGKIYAGETYEKVSFYPYNTSNHGQAWAWANFLETTEGQLEFIEKKKEVFLTGENASLRRFVAGLP